MDIKLVIDMYNKGKSLKEIGSEFGVSKSTVQRYIVKCGYVYDSSSKTYVQSNETASNDSIVKSDNVSRETIDFEKMVNGSYTIPVSLARALKFKAVSEDRKAIDIVREAIEGIVESKYFNL